MADETTPPWTLFSDTPVEQAKPWDDYAAKPTYDTPLAPWEEHGFQAWAGDRAVDTEDYDLKGYYKKHGDQPLGEGHLTDEFKKPNHPTFSNESIYHGVNGNEGGQWTKQDNGSYSFTPGATNLQYRSPDELQDYFDKVEPGNTLNIPNKPQMASDTPGDQPGTKRQLDKDELDKLFRSTIDDAATSGIVTREDLSLMPDEAFNKLVDRAKMNLGARTPLGEKIPTNDLNQFQQRFGDWFVHTDTNMVSEDQKTTMPMADYIRDFHINKATKPYEYLYDALKGAGYTDEHLAEWMDQLSKNRKSTNIEWRTPQGKEATTDTPNSRYRSPEELNAPREDFIGYLRGLFGGEKDTANAAIPPQDATKGKYPTDKRPYPTSEDVKYAKDNQFGYAQPWENYFKGEVALVLGKDKFLIDTKNKKTQAMFEPLSGSEVGTGSLLIENNRPGKVLDLNAPANAEAKEKIGDAFGKAALAANRSAVASLGFSPKDTLMDIRIKNPNIRGLTSSNPENKSISMYSNFGLGQDAIVHESIHRGIEVLKRRNPEANEIMKDLQMPEEMTVRYIMHKTMGDPEGVHPDEYAGRAQKAEAISAFENKVLGEKRVELLKRLESLAADEIAKKRPGGPR